MALIAPADRADPVVEVFGAVARHQQDADELLDDLAARVGSAATSDFRAELSFRDTVRRQAGKDQVGKPGYTASPSPSSSAGRFLIR
jgi:hypothetical protein